MANDLSIMQGVTLTNKKLVKATENIIKAGTTIGNAKMTIALELKKIDNDKLYEQDGFKSSVDYAMQVFGMSKTTAYELVKVGKYLSLETKKAVFPIATTDWSHTQLQALTPIDSVEVVNDLIDNEYINSDMSVRQIKEEVDKYLHGDEETEETESENVVDGNAEETESADLAEEITIQIFTNDVVIVKRCDEELDKSTAQELLLRLATLL